ncbi:MAG: sulfite exporter TauE/SafE family protein [Actinomycetota bacterium]|nr:sulfite exporter TauE/SafE family protein [Actinomycetota bacterium]
MTIYFLFFIATIVAGAINALAGGGGLITFPLLALVVPLATADATSAVALLCAYPAAVWRTRSELAEVPKRLIWLLLVPSVLGGLIGALLLSWSGDRNFVVLVPWLVLVATLLILVRPLLVPQSANGEDRHPLHFSPALWAVAALSLFLVALYGGYFGAGIGILIISTLDLLRVVGNIHRMVALKNLLAGCLRGVAVVVLVFEGLVDWRYGLPMALGGLVGGYLGGLASHRANRAVVRWTVIGIGFGVAAYYFWRLYGPPVMYVGGE